MNIDRNQIGELWDILTPKLYGYLVNVLKDPSLAQDVLQNTWLKAIEAIPRFKGSNKDFSSWLFSIARNEMKMHWRKGGREVPYDNEIHDIGEHIENPKDKIFIDQVLEKLPQEDRELIRLRYIADMSFIEIAKVLKMNVVSVRVKMHRALARIRLTINAHSYE